MMRKPHLNNDKLREVRSNADWRKLFDALGLKRDPHKSSADDWWAKSPFTDERDPSFHINDKGFYCFSTQESGGVIELVQAYFRHRTGEALNCYNAGRWLLEQGVSIINGSSIENKNGRSEGKRDVVEKLQEQIDNIKPVDNKRYFLTFTF